MHNGHQGNPVAVLRVNRAGQRRWLMITPPSTSADAMYCEGARRSPSMSMLKMSVKTGIRFMNMLALAAGMRLMLKP